MASTYSTNLAIELIGTGDQAGTWGNTTNTNLGTLIEQAVSGYVTQAVSTGTDTTITIPNGSSGVARNMFIELTGTGGTNTNLIVPANKKLYFIYNNTSGAVTVKVSGQTGVSVAATEKKILVSNGTDIVEATSYITTSAGSLTVTNLNVTSATITNLINTSATITTLTATSGSITNLTGTSVTITTLKNTSASITNLSATSLTVSNNATINSISVGKGAGSGADNTAVGDSAGDSMTTGYSNTCIGNDSGTAITTGYRNTFVGDLSAFFVSTGNSNVAVGYLAGDGMASNRTNNTALGTFAFYNGGAWDNSTCLGYSADVTGGNQVQLGNSGTTTYAYGAVQDRSDARDKTDIQDTDLGLSFVMALRPRKFKWDMREDYRTKKPENATPEQLAAWQEANKLANLTHDGTHVRSRFHQGLIAQEVKQTMDSMGIDFGGYQDHTVKGGDDVQSIGYNELIAPLIKAIQELKAEFDEYKRTHP